MRIEEYKFYLTSEFISKKNIIKGFIGTLFYITIGSVGVPYIHKI